MKILGRIGTFLSILILLTFCHSYSHSTGEQSFTKGTEYAAQGKFEQAMEEFRKVSKDDPYYQLTERALNVIEDVRDQEVESKMAVHLFRGMAGVLKKQWDQAIKECNKAIDMNPGHPVAYYYRGNAYHNKDQYHKAISDYNETIAVDSRFAMAYFLRGHAYQDIGQVDQAISDFSKAVEIDPRDDVAYARRGDCYRDKGQYDEAISDYTKAIGINPRDAWA